MSDTPETSIGAEAPKPTKLTTNLVLREAQSIAFRNPRFRASTDGFMGFTVFEEDMPIEHDDDEVERAIEAALEEGATDINQLHQRAEHCKPMSTRMGIEYQFDASRLEEIGGICYTWKAIVKQHHAELPGELAADIYGLPAEEAQREANKVMLTRVIEFSLSTADRSLETVESIEYVDVEDEEIISHVCSNPEGHDCFGDSSDQDDDSGGGVAVIDGRGQSRPDLMVAPAQEVIAVATAEDALLIWAQAGYDLTFDKLDRDLARYEYDANLKLAMGVIGRMKVLLAELGTDRSKG